MIPKIVNMYSTSDNGENTIPSALTTTERSYNNFEKEN